MNTHNIHNISDNSLEAVILNLLLIVDADGKIMKEEISFLLKNISNLKVITISETEISEKLIKNLIGEYYFIKASDKDYKKHIFRKLSDIFLINSTIVSMYELAKIDNEFHSSEKLIIEEAIKFWK